MDFSQLYAEAVPTTFNKDLLLFKLPRYIFFLHDLNISLPLLPPSLAITFPISDYEAQPFAIASEILISANQLINFHDL